MLDYAEHAFRMAQTDEKGVTKREHLEQAAKSLESAKEELEGPDFPDIAAYVWEAFMDLHASRQSGGMGPGAITYEGILAWSTLKQEWLTPWELDTVKALDALWFKVSAENHG